MRADDLTGGFSCCSLPLALEDAPEGAVFGPGSGEVPDGPVTVGVFSFEVGFVDMTNLRLLAQGRAGDTVKKGVRVCRVKLKGLRPARTQMTVNRSIRVQGYR